MLELLSPAGSPESVVAAVQNGADAVYLGLGGFNARHGARNFTEDEFTEAVRYCHIRGCRVYVTLNTLCADREMQEVARLGQFVSAAGADAVLVQDLGVARVLRTVCPDLTLHASTQMSVHNLAGVYAAQQLGMKRVVLARELSLDQIRYIAARSPLEIEVFVHGALCFCHSGQCYMSALIGRRSGNRGMCAQPCRMEYSLGRRMDAHPLSLRDNCLLAYVRELEEAGVACAKIEGRMKRPEYTAVVTGIYSKVIHGGAAPTPKDLEMLELAFSRPDPAEGGSGFTDGYLTGSRTGMHGVRPADAEKDAKGLYADAKRAYTGSEVRRVPIDFYASVRAGEPFRVTAEDADGHKVSVSGPYPEKASGTGVTEKSISDQLYKTGGTPYRCARVSVGVEPGLFLSASAVNEARRRAIADLTERRAELPRVRMGSFPVLPTTHSIHARPVLTAQVLNAAQITGELADLGISVLYVPLQLMAEAPAAAEPFFSRGIEVCTVLPRVVTDTEWDSVRSMLDKAYAAGSRTALVGNLGHIALASGSGFQVRGDFGLNLFNSFAMETIRAAGVLSAAASFELRMAQVRDLIKSVDTELIVYGRLPCMVTDQCLIRDASGGCVCSVPTSGRSSVSLSDRTGSVFPVVREYGCRNVIYNAHKLFLADKTEDLAACSLWGARLLFTTESAHECVEVARSYLGQGDYSPNGITRGLYYRGVE